MKFIYLSLALWACRNEEKVATNLDDNQVENIDRDEDGYFSFEDCDDNDATTNPGAAEICDGFDNNCNGTADEMVTSTFYADADNDGFGNPAITTEACEAPFGYVNNGSDCDDTNGISFPGAEEVCDGADNDCDSSIDEDLDIEFFADLDEDGFGDDNNIIEGCIPELGLSTIGGDCNDGDASIFPLANEICDGIDNNCDGSIDEGVANIYYADTDNDGFGDPNNSIEECVQLAGYVTNDLDCNDLDSQVNPNAWEACDAIDNDCDGTVDEDGAIDGLIWYQDGDADGHGNPDNTAVSCTQPVGYVGTATDCNDNDEDVYPGAVEYCNNEDDDCDSLIDEAGAINATTWYADNDNDGYGDNENTIAACSQPSGYTLDNNDCDDNDDDSYPGAPETCNGEDDNCDGNIDEGASTQTYYIDNDSDGYGDDSTAQNLCSPSSDMVMISGDCDDNNSTINPAADEQCDGVDNNCDSVVDEASAVDAANYYYDSDNDGYGEASLSVTACDMPSDYVSNNTDCDDGAADIFPGAAEQCDGIDNNCDGVVDESTAVDATTYYADYDDDGYGDVNQSIQSCSQPVNYVTDATDCDDNDDDIYPTADEVCNGEDDNCDGLVDDSSAVDIETWYADSDGDGYGDPSLAFVACDAPANTVDNSLDCNDNEAAINPIAAEICDQLDNDCDGLIDGSSAVDIVTWYRDLDGDGYGDSGSSVLACDQPANYAQLDGDCDDDNTDISPGANEVCNLIDDDCNGQIDEQGCAASCQEWYDDGYVTDGSYLIDPDGVSNGEDPIEVHCDMTTDGGGWTLCGSLTKGYVPSHMLYNENLYAFQARLNSDNNYVLETDAPGRYTSTWENSESLNYGVFCRHMSNIAETKLTAKLWNYSNNSGSSLKGSSYDAVYSGNYLGNLFEQWFTNTSSNRSFNHVSGDSISVYSDNNGYGGPYVAASISWSGSNVAYTHSSNPWGGIDSSVQCVGCTYSGSGYDTLPYGQTDILNNMNHAFWSGIPNLPYGWSDCTADGSCDYHESGYGVWLFYVR